MSGRSRKDGVGDLPPDDPLRLPDDVRDLLSGVGLALALALPHLPGVKMVVPDRRQTWRRPEVRLAEAFLRVQVN